MAKTKEIKEEVKEVTESKVSVEMSQKEKEEFVAFKLKQEEQLKKDKEKESQKQVNVDLRFAHKRNGIPYGPGRVTVPEDLGCSLLHQDNLAFDSRLAEMQDKKHNIQILQSGKAIITEVKESR